MTFALYNGLSDDFDRHDGSLSPYIDGTNVALPYETHYDLRMFHTTNVSVPWTISDNTWWTGFRYSAFGVGQIGTQRSLSNTTFRGRTQTELDTLTQTTLDALTQTQVENVVVSIGNEEWPTGDANVTVGKNSSYRYSNTIAITLTTPGTPKTVSSFYSDDIQTDFHDGGIYYLELTLRSLPAQAAAAHLNLANSFIDVSSDPNFAGGLTDSLSFSSNFTDLTAGGDTFVRWPVTNIVNADPTQLKAIRFRLQSAGSGSMTFTAQAMRIVKLGWPGRPAGLDTKRASLARQIPRAGGSEGSTLLGDIYFYQTRPKNITTYTEFNSGHLPATGTDDNILRQYFRYNPTTGDRIEVRIASRSTQTRLFIDQKVGGSTTNLSSTAINTNILTSETDYILVTTVSGTTVTATVYNAAGLVLGSQLGTLTTTGTTTVLPRGNVGFSFEPYNYDFYLYSIGTNVANFGTFLSTTFPSHTQVKGATLYPRNSPQEQMLNGGNIEAFGDATILTSDFNTYKVTRQGNLVQGGVRYNLANYIGDSAQVTVSGKIQPINVLHGTYRLGLIDENDSVAWIFNLTGLLVNQYNEFSVLLPPNLYPAQYYLHLQQSGAFPDTFFFRDLSLSHNTVGWEASIDAGTNWQPFLNALNYRWSDLRFSAPGSNLKVRATAQSDHSYISGYNLVPRYV